MANGNDGEFIESPDGGGTVVFDEPTEDAPIIDLRETINLVKEIRAVKSESLESPMSSEKKTGEYFLKDLGRLVVEDFNDDLESRKEWETRKARELELFSSIMPKKNYPWKDASNVNLPFITTACLQFHARAYEALLPPRNVAQCLATSNEDKPRAERVSAYMNYQLLYKMDDFEPDMDKTLLQVGVMGSVFKKTYYDPMIRRIRSIYCSAKDVVVNYGVRYNADRYRISHVLYLTRSDLRKRAVAGMYEKDDVWNLGHGKREDIISPELREVSNKIEGVQDTTEYNDNALPRTIIEQHREVDINGDGIDESVVVTVDKETMKVLRITPRFTTDVFNNPVEIDYFTHYTFIPNPEGFYAFGFGTLLLGLNESANTIVNEVIDAGALANLQGGFVSRRSGIKKGTVTFKMGEYKEVDTYIDDIQKAIYTLDFKGPNNTLYSVLGLLYEYAKLVSSVSETMTGQLPASDTPATTVLALLEEGRKVLSSIHRRLHRAFKLELRKIYRLNSIFLNEKEYFQVLGENNAPEGTGDYVAAEDFVFSGDVIPVSDPSITSKAEDIIKAKEVLEEVKTNPLTANNPASLFVATENYFKVIDAPNIKQLIQPPPPPPDLPPEEENAKMITEEPVQVLPDQDHLHHMTVHETFKDNEIYNQITPAAKQLLEKHHQQHLSALYLAQNGGSNEQSVQ